MTSTAKIISRRRDARIRTVELPAAIGLAVAFELTAWAGYALTVVRPALVERRFPL